MILLHMVLIYFFHSLIALVGEKKIYIHDEHKPKKFSFA